MSSFALCLTFALAVAGPAAAQRGGSNFLWYAAPGGSGNYGVLNDYYLTYGGTSVSQIVDSEFAQMVSNGQTALSILVLFTDMGGQAGTSYECPSTGTPGVSAVVDSHGGTMTPSCLSALAAVIQSAYNSGFSSVRVRFGPQGTNYPGNWNSGVNWTYADQNWNFIESVHNYMTSMGISLDKYDIGNEGIPATNKGIPYEYIVQYDTWLWSSYINQYGSADTVGFSVACAATCTNNLSGFPFIYGSTFPPVFDLHIYGQCGGSGETAETEYLNAWNYLKSNGWTQGWIIGETCYNDLATAQSLRAAQSSAGNLVYLLHQWTGAAGTETPLVPLAFNNYVAEGY